MRKSLRILWRLSVVVIVCLVSSFGYGCRVPQPTPRPTSPAADPGTLKVEAEVRRVDLNAVVKPVELKVQEKPVKLEFDLKPLDIRLPEKLSLNWTESMPEVQVRFPKELPPLVLEIKGSLEKGTADHGSCCTCKQDKYTVTGSGSGEATLWTPQKYYTTVLEKLDTLLEWEASRMKLLKKLEDQSPETRLVDVKAERDASVTAVEELKQKIQWQIKETTPVKSEPWLMLAGIVAVGSVGGVFQFFSKKRKDRLVSNAACLKPVSMRFFWDGAVKIMEGVVAALMVPAIVFLARPDLLESVSKNPFHKLSFGSMCLVAAMIGGPFIQRVLDKAEGIMNKKTEPKGDQAESPKAADSPSAKAAAPEKSGI